MKPNQLVRVVALACVAVVVTGCGASTPPLGPQVTPTLGVVDGVTAVPVGGGPVGLTVAPDGRVWVALADARAVVALTPDGEGYDVGEPIALPGLPLRVRVVGDGLWVSLFDRGRIVRVDTVAGTLGELIVAGREPEGLAVTGDVLWVVDQGGGAVQRFVDGGPQGSAPVGAGPRLVAPIGPDGDAGVVVTSYRAGTVSVVAPDLSVHTTPALCVGVQGVAVDAAGQRAFVSCTDSDELVAVDLATLAEVGRVGGLGRPDAVTVGPDGTVYVAQQRGPAIVALDPTTLAETGRVALAERIAGLDSNIDLVVDPAGRLLLTWPEAGQVLVVPPSLLTPA